MNEDLRERLYQLLPTLYRRRDLAQGEPLRALLAVLEGEYQDLETDLLAQYDNWFIDTCDAWVIPYLADLVGVRELAQRKFVFSTQRRQVANTIGYRRRKGTLPALEHVLTDASSWHVSAVEFGQRLAMTQHVNHVRAGQGRMVDMRQAASFASSFDPWAGWAHTFDVHNRAADRLDDPARLGQRRGRYQMDQVGLYIWRLNSYPMLNGNAHRVAARQGDSAARSDAQAGERADLDGRYRFHPLGRDMPLFVRPRAASDISERLVAAHVPAPITRQALAADLNLYRRRFATRAPGERPPASELYGPERSVCVCVDGQPIPPFDVMAVALDRWRSAAARELYRASQRDTPVALVDPQLGRLVVLNAGDTMQTGRITVHYSYGFSCDIGGGPYHRQYPGSEGNTPWQVDIAEGTTVATLQDALKQWEVHCQQNSHPEGVIRFLDNGGYGGSLDVLLPPDASLAIVADNGVRPAIEAIGRLVVKLVEPLAPLGAEHSDTYHQRRLELNGLLIEGGVRIEDTGRAAATEGQVTIKIGHCTLMATGLEAALGASQAAAVSVELDSSIVGPLVLPESLRQVSVTNCIMDAAGRYALAGPGPTAGPAARLGNTTIFGRVWVRDLEASAVIFTDPVQAAQPATAEAVRHSFIPAGSTGLQGEAYAAISLGSDPPQFVSTRYGDPAYAQLSVHCAPEIRAGAADGSEIGAFHDLHALQAEANLRAALAEYLPLGLRPSLFLQT